jgi:tryptophanyl-tRNA synthetase
MSKSDKEISYIGLFDEPSVLEKKIMGAVTDTGNDIVCDEKKKPGVSNLLSIYSMFSDTPIKELETQFKGKGYGDLKKETAKLLVAKLAPFRKKKKELSKKDSCVEKTLKDGAKKASAIASSTMEDVRRKTGLA